MENCEQRRSKEKQGCLTLPNNVRILVVDDDQFCLTVLCSMLESIEGTMCEYGMPQCRLEITRSATGEEAWAQLNSGSFDLAFVDVLLPGITGLDLSWCYKRHLAESQQAGQTIGSPETVLIACTSNIKQSQLDLSGMADVLHKPVSMAVLRHTLHKWLPRLHTGQLDISSLGISSVSGSLGAHRDSSRSMLMNTTRILQVEDCRIAASAVQNLFQSLGFWIDTVANGEEAMAFLASPRQYALVLLDLHLPCMSGYALSSWYKEYCKRSGRHAATIVAVTADPDREQCHAFGIDRCFPKPLTTEMVSNLVSQWLMHKSHG